MKNTTKSDLATNMVIKDAVDHATATEFLVTLLVVIEHYAMRGFRVEVPYLGEVYSIEHKPHAAYNFKAKQVMQTASYRRMSIAFTICGTGHSRKKIAPNMPVLSRDSLYAELASRTDQNIESSRKLANNFAIGVANSLLRNQPVQLRGFGSFTIRKGQHNTPVFKPSSSTIWTQTKED